MDAVDGLARKLIEAFERLRDSLVLEQLAVPEDLADPAGSVDLWVASAGSYDDPEEGIVVRGRVTMPTAVALENDAEELSLLFREELLGSERFGRAGGVARVVGRVADGRGVPSPEEAEKN